jgi:signal transduction histidine kinase
MRLALPSALRRLADRVLEVSDVGGLSQLLGQMLPDLLSVSEVSFLIWNRRLDAFQGLIPGKTKLAPLQSHGEAAAAPDARYLISDGALIDTGSTGGPGTLVPLMARSGLVGMLVLGPRRTRRRPPFQKREAELLSQLASRVALAVENHFYQSELIESERMSALGTMASMLAHDFRGPMTVIRGYAETFLDPGISPAEVRSRAEVIMRMVDRLDRMATETLDFARGGGQLVRRAVDLLHALDQIADEIAREFPALVVERRFALPRAATAWLDVDKLQRAIGNIAANAREAMGAQGRFILSARIDQAQAAPEEPPAPRLVLTLADEGPGVPPEIRDRLFEPFVTVGKKRGTGLGLAVARRFVEDHGGSLALLPPRDGLPPGTAPGARFRIVLPLVTPPTGALVEAPEGGVTELREGAANRPVESGSQPASVESGPREQ